MKTMQVTLDLTKAQVEQLLSQIDDATAPERQRKSRTDSIAYKTREAIKKLIDDKPMGYIISSRSVEIFFAVNQLEFVSVSVSKALGDLVDEGILRRVNRTNYAKV